MDKAIKIVWTVVVCFFVSLLAIVLICLPWWMTYENPYMLYVMIIVCTVLTSLGKILDDNKQPTETKQSEHE